VTGTLALKAFLEELLADDPEAAAFRARYRVLVVPLVNPDGVDEGHWRQNAGGVDLNRDWLNFNQPEVRLVRDAFVSTVRDAGAPVAFTIDFHSTQDDIFYTHTRDLETNRPGLLDAWLDSIRAAVPGYELVEEASGLETPVSKDWFYEAFDATSVTYEVGDEQDRALIARVAAASARSLMRLLTQPGDG
jgi:predicted deacylase